MAEDKRPIVSRVLEAMTTRADGWANVLTGLGTIGRDKRLSSIFGTSNRISADKSALSEMFDGDDLVGTICELPAKEMTREWFDLLISDDDDENGTMAMQTMQFLDELGAQSLVCEAITWARLYGGSVIYIYIAGPLAVA